MTAARLAIRLSRAIDGGRGIKLSAAELDLLVVSGAMETFLMSVAAEQRAKMRAKLGMIEEEWTDDD